MTFSPGPASFIRGPKSASPSNTRGGSRVPEWGPLGSVRGALSNERPAISEMSSQIIPLKAHADSQDPSRIPAREDHSRLSCSAVDTQLGAGFCRDLQQAFCTDVGHHDAGIGRDLFRSEDDPPAAKPATPLSEASC